MVVVFRRGVSSCLPLRLAGVAEKGWKFILKTWNSLQNRIMTLSMPKEKAQFPAG